MIPLEVEFLPVGRGSKPGDAIAIRYGGPDQFYLIVIDGGTATSGEALVRHLQALCASRPIVSDLIVTHPDLDHSSGARVVLENVHVSRVWTHVPWWHSEEVLPHLKDGRWTRDGLTERLISEYDVIAEIVRIARAKGAIVQEPFAGATIGPFTVLSPPRWAYPVLVANFPDTPKPTLASAGFGSLSPVGGFANALATVGGVLNENWSLERLRDDGQTSARNESSVVLYGQLDGWRPVLLTGDAGNLGLTWTAETANALGLPLQRFSLVQIPHHGSRRNVGPTVLNRLIGPKISAGVGSLFTAVVSAPQDDVDHPRKIVLNAFMRRGARVLATQGASTCFGAGYPARSGYGPAIPVRFSASVEAYV